MRMGGKGVMRLGERRGDEAGIGWGGKGGDVGGKGVMRMGEGGDVGGRG